MNLIERNIVEITSLCEKHKVKELYLLGSALTDRFSDTSGVDVLVQFGEVNLVEYFDNYMDFK